MIVSNTSPLIGFSKIGELELLRKLFGTISVPEAVLKELCSPVPGARRGEVEQAILGADWIAHETVGATAFLSSLSILIDPGESEAIALACTKRLSLLIDDAEGRRIAKRLGVDYFGSLGVLKLAKLRGLIAKAKPYVHHLQEAGIFFSQDLIHEFLKDVGEA